MADFSFLADSGHIDASHFDVLTPDGHSVGSIDVNGGGVHFVGPDGIEVAHSEHFEQLDTILDARGFEVATVDHAGYVWHDGSVVSHVQQHADGSVSIEMPDGHPLGDLNLHGSSPGLHTPAGAAVLLLQQRFGV